MNETKTDPLVAVRAAKPKAFLPFAIEAVLSYPRPASPQSEGWVLSQTGEPSHRGAGVVPGRSALNRRGGCCARPASPQSPRWVLQWIADEFQSPRRSDFEGQSLLPAIQRRGQNAGAAWSMVNLTQLCIRTRSTSCRAKQSGRSRQAADQLPREARAAGLAGFLLPDGHHPGSDRRAVRLLVRRRLLRRCQKLLRTVTQLSRQLSTRPRISSPPPSPRATGRSTCWRISPTTASPETTAAPTHPA